MYQGDITKKREIITTNKRPDIVIWPKSSKQVVILELAVQYETHMEEAHKRKAAKFESLVDGIKDVGWRVWYFPVEVGSRGFT